MAKIIAIASGKGGVGKSMIATNVALLFARQGRQVVLMDLDIGGANLHILLGVLNPSATLTDFIERNVDSLESLAQPIPWGSGLRFIPGTGNTLATANLLYAQKKRLMRHVRSLKADIIILDCAPGASYQALDFFLLANVHVLVATPDPASVIELYRFLQLATIRNVVTSGLSREEKEVGKKLARQEFSCMQEILDVRGQTQDVKKTAAAFMTLPTIHPSLLFNRVSESTKLSASYLQQMALQFIGRDFEVLGEIPQDTAVEQSVRSFLPVVDYAPYSPAATALTQMFHVLQQQVNHEKEA